MRKRAGWKVVRRWSLRLLLTLLLIVGLVVATYVSSRNGAPDDVLRVHSVAFSRKPTGDPSEELIVGAYNIAHGRGGEIGASNRRADGKAGLIAHLEVIGAEIREQGLDIVVLNEVDFASSWSWKVNQASVIARVAGLNWILEQRNYDASLPYYSWAFGNVILSRYPIYDPELIELPAFKEREAKWFGKKEACSCRIKTPEGELRVVAVHLEARDAATREASMKILHERAGEFDLIMGDFNSEVVFAGSERLTSARGTENTFSSGAPNRRIDWIFSGAAVLLGFEEVFGGALSDHLGVKAQAIGLE